MYFLVDSGRLATNIYKLYMIGALLYFLVDSLWILDHFYRYSMANFVIMFKKGMDLSGESDDVAQRVRNIIETACYTVFAYVAQGLFERHKLIFATVCSHLRLRFAHD